MNIAIDFNNQTKFDVSLDFLVKIARETLKESDFSFLLNKNLTVSVAFVENDEMRELNNKFRGKDKKTDVLSFGNYANKEELQKEEKADVLLGEIILAPKVIYEAAIEDEISFEKELAFIFSHGVLHLLGFNHEEEMFKIQDEITQNI